MYISIVLLYFRACLDAASHAAAPRQSRLQADEIVCLADFQGAKQTGP
jgi:hypothetical protein